MDKNKQLNISGRRFTSRLFTGTGKFSSLPIMKEAIDVSGSELVTVALKRVDIESRQEKSILYYLQTKGLHLLPNTSGVRTAKEAIFAASVAKESMQTNWIKLEIHPNPRHLLPDGVETLKAAEELVKQGFVVLPYIHADPVLCKRLEDVGVPAVMPLAAPIGTNNGLRLKDMLEIIIDESNVPVIVDAGIGAPSHASEVLEMGADAVLVNTAIAVADDPINMAKSFKMAVESGRLAFESGLGMQGILGNNTSPLVSFFNENE